MLKTNKVLSPSNLRISLTKQSLYDIVIQQAELSAEKYRIKIRIKSVETGDSDLCVIKTVFADCILNLERKI